MYQFEKAARRKLAKLRRGRLTHYLIVSHADPEAPGIYGMSSLRQSDLVPLALFIMTRKKIMREYLHEFKNYLSDPRSPNRHHSPHKASQF